MSNTRERLAHARQAYRRVRYPGDLADDIFARLDAGETLDAAGPSEANDADANVHVGPARHGRWRPLLAMAAALAVIATTAYTVRRASLDRRGTEIATHDVVPPTVTTPPTAGPLPKGVDSVATADTTSPEARRPPAVR